MKKIFFLLPVFFLLVNCSSGEQEIDQSGAIDSTQNSSGSISEEETMTGTQELPQAPAPVSEDQDTPISSSDFSSGGMIAPSLSPEQKKDIEEIVDEADKDIEGFIEEIFQADAQK